LRERPFFVYSPVQTDKTADALAEIEPGIRELDLGQLRFIDADGNPVGD
jgi:hypothetical protein